MIDVWARAAVAAFFLCVSLLPGSARALGMETLTTRVAHGPSKITVEGPRLSQAMAAAGASGRVLTAPYRRGRLSRAPA